MKKLKSFPGGEFWEKSNNYHNINFFLENVTRYCLENGNWSRVNYIEACKEIVPEETTIFYYYFAGYTLSLVTLSLAIIILTHFKWVRSIIFYIVCENDDFSENYDV